MSDVDDGALVDAPEGDGQVDGQLAIPVAPTLPKWDTTCPDGAGIKKGSVTEVAVAELASRDKYDWTAMRRTYVEGIRREDPKKGSYTWWPNVRDVARLNGCTEQAARQRCGSEGWVMARAAWQAKMEQVRQEMRAKALAQQAVSLDKNAINSATNGLGLIMMRIQEITDQQIDLREKRKSGQPLDAESEFEAVIDGRELETLGRAATAWHALGQKVLGIEKATQIQISGPNGGPIDVRQSVAQEMRRDDPDRLYGFLVAAERSGLLGPAILEGSLERDDEDAKQESFEERQAIDAEQAAIEG